MKNLKCIRYYFTTESWRQHLSNQQLYGPLPPITKTIKIRQTRHAGYISNVLLWTPSHARAKAGRPAWTYIQQLCTNMGCSPEDLPEAMNNREGWWEGQGYPCWRCDMMMLMMIKYLIFEIILLLKFIRNYFTWENFACKIISISWKFILR